MIGRVGSLARKLGAYIAADTLWRASTGLHDTALLIAPDGKEAERRAKINITAGEEAAGIVPGPRGFPVTVTPYGKVGIAICGRLCSSRLRPSWQNSSGTIRARNQT